MSNEPRTPIGLDDLRSREVMREFTGTPDDAAPAEKPSALSKVVAIVSYYAGSLVDELKRLADTSKLNVEIGVGKAQLAFSYAKPTNIKKRRWIVAFDAVEIPPGETKTITGQPQCLFKGQKIMMTGDIEGLAIVGLFVGNRIQLPVFGGEGIPASLFAPDVENNELTMDTCDPALLITWQIRNSSDAPKKFAASIIGDAVM